jgi:four helix bundle protein
MEVETYVMIAERLGFVTSEATREVLDRITELGRMLTSLRQRLVEPRT